MIITNIASWYWYTEEPTAVVPTVTTGDVSSISYTSATVSGNVTADGGATVTARGICYGTSQNPTITGSKVVSGSGTGSFTANLTGLTAGTTYYVRAYATNSAGTAYGSNVTLATESAASDWELILDIPFYSDLIDQVNNISADITNSTYCHSTQATLDTTNHWLNKNNGGNRYKNVVYINLASTQYPQKLRAASMCKIEMDIYTTYISGSGTDQYASPFAFGAMSSQSTVGNALILASISNNADTTSGRYVTRNSWYTITYECDLTTGDYSISNGTNTDTLTGTTLTSTTLNSNSYYTNYFTIFPKRWSGPQSWSGRLRNLKIYVK